MSVTNSTSVKTYKAYAEALNRFNLDRARTYLHDQNRRIAHRIRSEVSALHNPANTSRPGLPTRWRSAAWLEIT
jgi:hypothetical protein